MKTYIALLRGINVGGGKKILMADLRALCEAQTWANVQTYIQTGNIVFQSASNPDSLKQQLEAAIKEKYGFEVLVFVYTLEEWREIIASNLFIKEDKEQKACHLTMLSASPSEEKIADLQTVESGEDEFRIIGKAMYLYTPNGYGKTKLANPIVERKLKLDATTRNWATSLKILEMADSLE